MRPSINGEIAVSPRRKCRCRSGARKWCLFQFQGSDRLHDALTQACIKIFITRLKIGFGKINWLADHNRYRMEMKSPAARKRWVRAKDSHRHNRRQGSRDNQSESRLRCLQFAIERAGAFRKNESALATLQHSNYSFKRTAIDAFLLHGNDVEFRQEPAEHRHV